MSISVEPDTLPREAVSERAARGGLLRHLGTAAVFATVAIVLLGIVYPLAMTGIAQLAFRYQADGSMQTVGGRAIGSAIIGERWTHPQYFQGRPSAAGSNGYDPTATGGTNLGPASKKLIDATRAAIRAQKAANPDATRPIPIDLVTSSASGIDPDISPEAALYQAPRIAKARHLRLAAVNALAAQNVRGKALGFLGEPHVNVLELNLALDAAQSSALP